MSALVFLALDSHPFPATTASSINHTGAKLSPSQSPFPTARSFSFSFLDVCAAAAQNPQRAGGGGQKEPKEHWKWAGSWGLDYLGPVAWVAVENHKYRMGTSDDGGKLVW